MDEDAPAPADPEAQTPDAEAQAKTKTQTQTQTQTPDAEPAPVKRRRGPRLTRRRLFGLVGGGMLAGASWRMFAIDPPTQLSTLELSKEAQQLIAKCWKGLDPAKVIDMHVHVMGMGIGGTGCFVHPDATSVLSPVRFVKTRFYKGAAGIHDDDRADGLFVERLVDLVMHQRPRGRFLLMAFDKHHDQDGKANLNQTEFYTPNDYVAKIAKQQPEALLVCASVHPYRPDALDELERCKKDLGAVAIKWLPNAMGIDPMDPRCDAFYEKAVALKMPIISHGGEEQAVHAEDAQELGNPLRLRRALDHGVKVVVAHCASLGESQDLDAPKDNSGKHPRVAAEALFRRMLKNASYRGRLYGDTSAMTQFNRCEQPLRETIASGIGDRLVNGSDYPLPAIDPLIRTGQLEDLGYITSGERELINQIFEYNPLTFDFVLKRCLKVERDGVVHKIPDSAFETAHLFGL